MQKEKSRHPSFRLCSLFPSIAFLQLRGRCSAIVCPLFRNCVPVVPQKNACLLFSIKFCIKQESLSAPFYTLFFLLEILI